MKALLVDMGGGQWRVREAASLAVADLLQGRHWPELQPHFGELWAMTLRWVGGQAGGRPGGGALLRCAGGARRPGCPVPPTLLKGPASPPTSPPPTHTAQGDGRHQGERAPGGHRACQVGVCCGGAGSGCRGVGIGEQGRGRLPLTASRAAHLALSISCTPPLPPANPPPHPAPPPPPPPSPCSGRCGA